jgi:hypothetical protein
MRQHACVAATKGIEERGTCMQRSRALPCLAVIIAVAVAGCGGSDKNSPADQTSAAPVSVDQRSILATIDALQTASRKGDGHTICDELFTPQLVRSVEKSAKRSCATELREKLFVPNAELSVGRQMTVVGNRGTAVIREKNGDVSKLSLLEQHGRWRIDRVTPEKTA